MPVQKLNPEELARKILSGEISAVLDVRSFAEYAGGHIEDSMLAPIQILETRAGDLDRSRSIALVCRSGQRSARAAEQLQAMGFRKLYCLDGGLEAWKAQGLPLKSLPAATSKQL